MGTGPSPGQSPVYLPCDFRSRKIRQRSEPLGKGDFDDAIGVVVRELGDLGISPLAIELPGLLQFRDGSGLDQEQPTDHIAQFILHRTEEATTDSPSLAIGLHHDHREFPRAVISLGVK